MTVERDLRIPVMSLDDDEFVLLRVPLHLLPNEHKASGLILLTRKVRIVVAVEAAHNQDQKKRVSSDAAAFISSQPSADQESSGGEQENGVRGLAIGVNSVKTR